MKGSLHQAEAETAQQQTTVTTLDYSEEMIRRQMNERTAAKRKIENVEITIGEQRFIRQLASYLGHSPRRIKRFANTYRLLKSGLTRQESLLFAVDDTSNDDYRIVLVFLAIITGAPSLAPLIFSKAFTLREHFDVKKLIKEAGLDESSAGLFEATNAKGVLALLKEVNVTTKKIETWVPRVMRYAFRLTPVHVTAM